MCITYHGKVKGVKNLYVAREIETDHIFPLIYAVLLHVPNHTRHSSIHSYVSSSTYVTPVSKYNETATKYKDR